MAGRRQPPPVPTGPPPPIAHLWRLLIDLWRHVVNSHVGLPIEHNQTHLRNGVDPLETDPPDHVDLANAAGTPDAGAAITYSLSDHEHGDIKRDVRVKKTGSDVGTRNALNFIEGAGVTLTVADNAGSDRVDVTVAATSTLSDDAEILAFFLSRVEE